MDISGIIKGLHHVTATVNDAQEDYNFYTKLLGQRLVKETVNFDNEDVYHFYYGNQLGLPSTIFTTFPYKDRGVRDGVIGTGQVSKTGFSIPEGSYSFWKERLNQAGVILTESELLGNSIIEFDDPSGLHLYLIESEDPREPIWYTEDISSDVAIRGIHSVMLLVADAGPSIEFLKVFGYEEKASENNFWQLETSEGGAGNTLFVEESASAPRGLNGLGTVHHVAHRSENIEESLKIKSYAESIGLSVTEVKDRKYFQSIYFRIPGGILFEVATIGPGFTVDESEAELGQSLKLPDWQEPNRERIEANLEKYDR